MEFKEIEKRLFEFRTERNWDQFHKIKDLLLAINIEVSELQELYLWKTEEQHSEIDVEKIKDELADIAIYLTYICKHHNIDLLEAVSDKIVRNGIKYPVEKSRNSIRKYNEL